MKRYILFGFVFAMLIGTCLAHNATTGDVNAFKQALEKDGFTVQQGVLGYFDFIKLVKEARFVITDSGGIQEETTFLKVPCLAMRENTERPVTLESGNNVLVGADPDKIIAEFARVLDGARPATTVPRYWDGQAAKRIVQVLLHAPASAPRWPIYRWPESAGAKAQVI